MMSASNNEHYVLAYALVKDAIYDELINETLWFYEDEELPEEYDLQRLQDIIRDIAYHVGQ